MNAYAVEAVHRDEGSVVLFEASRMPENGSALDGTVYLLAVDHRMAQAIVEDLEGGEPVIVEAEGWQIVGTVR